MGKAQKETETKVVCPKCGSTDLEQRNHEQVLQKAGGVLLTSAGAAAGTVGVRLWCIDWCGHWHCRRTFRGDCRGNSRNLCRCD
jgi:hypothetical protein